jgi:hypothetical protein
MDYVLDLKDKFISLLVDGAERGKKNLCVILARGAQKLCFIHFRNLESRNCLQVAQCHIPIM